MRTQQVKTTDAWLTGISNLDLAGSTRSEKQDIALGQKTRRS